MKSDDDIIYPPPIPRIYRDHRKFIYQLTVSKTLTHPDKSKEGEKQWSVVQYRNITPSSTNEFLEFRYKRRSRTIYEKTILLHQEIKLKN